MLSSGAGVLVDFTLHIKDVSYYLDLDNRISKAYGSNEWMKHFGTDMHEQRLEKAKELVKVEEVMEDEMDDALLVGVVTPKRVRKKTPVSG